MIPDGFNVCCSFEGQVPVKMVFRRMIHEERVHAAHLEPMTFLVALASKVQYDSDGADIIRLFEFLQENDEAEFIQIADSITGQSYLEEEKEDEFRLTHGTQLRIKYPHLLQNPCEMCKKYVFFPRKGEYLTDNYGAKAEFEVGVDTLACRSPAGCPRIKAGEPDSKFWDQRCESAYLYDAFCRNSNTWPDDMTVQRNKLLIDNAIKDLKKQ